MGCRASRERNAATATSMTVLALLDTPALERVRAELGSSTSVAIVQSPAELIRQLLSFDAEAVVVDPSLMSVRDAEAIASYSTLRPRTLVAYTSLTSDAVQSSVILARCSSTRFVFRGTMDERVVLARALMVSPQSQLGVALVFRLGSHIDTLPRDIRECVLNMLHTGQCSFTSEALAMESGVGRRSLDRWLTRAGFASSRLLIATGRVAAGYHAITHSRVPLKRVAAMLGYATQRTMDSQVCSLLGKSSSRLRLDPIPISVAAELLTCRLLGAAR